MKTREHYIKLFAHYPDVVTLDDFQKMLGGIGDSTARKLMRENRVYHFYIRCTYLIPKQCVIDYILSDHYAAQTIQVNLPGSETYILSGWAKADSVPLNDPDNRSFQITAMISYSEGEPEYHQNPFTHLAPGQWQFICVPIVPDSSRTVTSITVTCSYKGNANIAYFDDISLIRELAQSYTYDEDGNVVAVNKTNTDEITAEYIDDNLTKEFGGANGTYEYDYDEYNNVKSVTNGGVKLDMTCDSVGNVTDATLTGSDDTFMSSATTYTDGGTKVASTTDNLGNTAVNTYNTAKNLLTSVTVPLSDSNIANSDISVTYYTYDEWNRPGTTYKTGYVSLDYSYDKGAMSNITRGGYLSPGVGDKISQIYSLTYNDYGQNTKTQVGVKDSGTRTLATKGYNNSTHNLSVMMYGNGDVVSYTYDNLDRLKTIRYNDIDVLVTYTYDYMGNVAVAKVTNYAKTTEYATYSYEYDSLGRLIRFYETKDGDIVQQAQYTFDSKNRPIGVTYFDGSVTRSESVTYNDDGNVSVYNLSDTSAGAVSMTYDGLQRITEKTYDRGTNVTSVFNVTKKYTYKAGEVANQTTSLVSCMMYDYRSEGTDVTLNYTYDNLGNITKVTDGSGNTLARYVYDNLNQLVLEEVHPVNGAHYTMVYEYDTFGNIRKEYKYAEGGYSYPGDAHTLENLVYTNTYSYTDSSWADLLTSYNGTSITYDTIGNPISYYNGQSYTFTWENGKQLASAVTGGKTVTFEYNADGIRTEKHLSGTHDIYYRLLGNKVVEMKKLSENGTDRFVFIYDNSGAPYAIEYYNPYSGSMSKYYYVLNLQGDVIQIVDSENCVVANYNYDAWGKVLSVTDSNGNVITNTLNIANVNPIRYRGYFYDSETGFYYCNSRYYDPAMRRFINADAFASTGQGFLGFNMFAYSQNNPVMLVDPSGCVVTEWDKAHVNIYDLQLLELYTKTWERADLTAKEKEYQHYLATEVRKKYISPGDIICCDGTVITANKVKGLITNTGDGWLFALYDNDRFENVHPYHEQILVINTDNACFEPSKFMFSAGISGDLFTGGWEFDNFDLSLMDFGHVGADLKFSPSEITIGASASVWSPSISTSFWGIGIEFGAEIIGAGAEFSIANNKFNFRGALGAGFGLTITW